MELCTAVPGGHIVSIRTKISAIDLTTYEEKGTKILSTIGQLPFPHNQTCQHIDVRHLNGEYFTDITIANDSRSLTYMELVTNHGNKISAGFQNGYTTAQNIKFAFNDTKVGFYGNFQGPVIYNLGFLKQTASGTECIKNIIKVKDINL